MSYEPHPLCLKFPPMDANEFAALKGSIEAEGQLIPIVIWENQILDGRNRYNACVELGIEPTVTLYDGSDPASFVIATNMARRGSNPGQRACQLAMVLDYVEKHPRGRTPVTELKAQFSTTADRARTASTSLSVMKRAERLREERLDLCELVSMGAMTFQRALNEAFPKPVPIVPEVAYTPVAEAVEAAPEPYKPDLEDDITNKDITIDHLKEQLAEAQAKRDEYQRERDFYKRAVDAGPNSAAWADAQATIRNLQTQVEQLNRTLYQRRVKTNYNRNLNH
jgi:hypothetical protein